MPITEVVRILASAQGRTAGGVETTVELVYDTDGSFGPDRLAIGSPNFWLRVDSHSHGPYSDESVAIEAAEALFSARFT
jgi:hypothetical protein